MSVFREVTIKWEGAEYQVVPSMRVLRQIESNGISLTDIAFRTSKGSAPVSHIAYVLSVLLKSAGAPRASEDEVYAAIMTGSERDATQLVSAVLEAFNPAPNDDGKKPAARQSGRSKSKTSPTN